MADHEDRQSHDSLIQQSEYLRRLSRQLVQAPDADDVTQEALTLAMERPPRQAGAMRAWLARVATNLVRRRERSARCRRWHEHLAPRDGDAFAQAADEIAIEQELLAQLMAAARGLQEPYRTTVHLRYFDDLTPRQIAASSDLPVATVKTRLRRALVMLRAALDAEHGGARRAWLTPLSGIFGLGSVEVSLAKAAVVFVVVSLSACAAFELTTGPDPAATSTTEVEPAESAGEAEPQAATSPSRQSVPGVEKLRPQRWTVSGRVIDAAGRPVPDLKLMLSIRPGSMKRGDLAWMRSDAEGRFQHALKESAPVSVGVRDERFRVTKRTGVHETPVEGLVLRVRRIPHAILDITLRDFDSGELVKEFSCRFHVAAKGYSWPFEGRGQSWRGGVFHGETKTERFEQPVPTHEDGAVTKVHVWLRDRGIARKLLVRSGEQRRVELVWNRGPGLVGFVRDSSGQPVRDALVFGGSQERARGDEPFKPFQPARIRDGVRTDDRGRFRLRTRAEVVTAWHPRLSPVTVRRGAAANISLPQRGSIVGRVLDGAGRAVAGATLVLETSRTTTTGADGRFAFADVEAGVNGIWQVGDTGSHIRRATGGPWIVNVDPGRRSDVTLHPGLTDVTVRISGPGLEAAPWREGALVGIDPVGGATFGRIRSAQLTVRKLLPGRYVFLSDRGHVAPCEILGPAVDLDLGSHRLRVKGDVGQKFWLVPAGAHEVLVTMARRMAAQRITNEAATVGPLPAGDYEIWTDGAVEPLRVVVGAAPVVEVKLLPGN